MSRILILRPEPGASETAARARALGLEPVIAPLFTVRPLAWEPPEADFDAVLLTSANAARHAGSALRHLVRLPCFTVGEATAEAARQAGFPNVRSGPADGAAAIARASEAGACRILHLCGREHILLAHPGVELERRFVYVAEAVAELPPRAAAAVEGGILALIHSPRAAALFGALVAERLRVPVAAISRTAAEAAGGGWAAMHVAPAPRDQALLELAAKLCKTAASGEQDRS